MRSGEARREEARRPGLWTTWGQSIDVATGGVLPPNELVRASLGRPVVWVVTAWLTGGAVGDIVLLKIAAGLGTVFGKADFVFPKTAAASDFFVQPGVGIPATELVISAALTAPAIAALSLIVQVAPLVWPPDVDPRALEPAL